MAKLKQKTHGVPNSNPVITSSPMNIPDNVDEFDLMAAGSSSSLKHKVFKAPSTSEPTLAASEPPRSASKKKRVTFRLSSSQKDKVNQRENVGSNAEIPIPEQSSHSSSTPTNRNKRRDTVAGFQFPPASTPKSSKSRTPGSGGPLNEDFWNSITEESTPFVDVSFSRVSPKKTSTVTSAFSQHHSQSPVASSFFRSIPSHSSRNNKSSFVDSNPLKSKFKFPNISQPQVTNSLLSDEVQSQHAPILVRQRE